MSEAEKPEDPASKDETEQTSDKTSDRKGEGMSQLDLEDVLSYGIRFISAAYGAIIGWGCGDKIKSTINDAVNGSVDDITKDMKK